MVVAETERLILRRLTPGDAAFILGLLNEPSFIENIGDRGVRTLEAARGYIEQGAMASYRDNGYGLYLVERREDGAQLGICGLVKRPYLDDADIGFAFLPAYWSQGYALESARAVMAHARDSLGLARVVAIVSPGNQRSVRLLQKLGLGYLRTLQLPSPGGTVEVFGPPESVAGERSNDPAVARPTLPAGEFGASASGSRVLRLQRNSRHVERNGPEERDQEEAAQVQGREAR